MPIVPSGSTNLAAVGVPNVLVQIQAPNPLLNGVPTNIVGVVGTAIWGPVNAPTIIGTLQDLVLMFGAPQPVTFDMGTQVYNAIQQGANNFVCVRVTDGTDAAASANILDVSSALGAILTSKYTGTLPNTGVPGGGLNAVISVGSGNTASPATPNAFKLSIYFNGGVPEVFDNITGSGAAFWTNLVNAVNLGQNQLRGPSNICTAVTNNDITAVTVNSAGSYATLPTLGTSGPGSGAVLVPTMLCVSGAVQSAGTGYAPTDTFGIVGGSHSIDTVFEVFSTNLASIAVNVGGSNYLVGDLITLAGGTAIIPAVLQVTTVSGGAVTGVSIFNSGEYTANSTSFTQGSTSGVGSGATFNTAVFGVEIATISTAGAYTALPTDPVSTSTLTGVGTGATMNLLWGLLSVNVTSAGTGYTTASQFTVTGGGGTGGATGLLVLGSSALAALASYTFSGGLNGNANVTDSELIGIDGNSRKGMYALRKTGASIAVLADQTNPTYWTNQNAFGLQEGMYMIATMIGGLQDNITGAISAKQSGGIASYAFKLMQGDWDYINDPFNGIARLVSPQGFVAGILAVQQPSGSSLNKIMNGLYATQKSSEQHVYSDADLLQLQINGIDVVTNQLPIAPTQNVFGVRLGCNTSTSPVTNGDNYTRMINFLAQTFNTGLGLYIGLPQTPDVQAQARATLQTFLQNLVSLGMIGTIDGSPAFRVILDATNNPPQRVALGFMQADVQVVLYSIIQRFVINLQAGQSVQIEVLPAQLGNQLAA